MEISSIVQSPRRITDLVEARCAGADVRLDIDFEIRPVDFHHRTHPFKAFIFLAAYTGTIGAQKFAFRKCYARGCPNNLCTHVSQAVRIANRYLQRDYHALRAAGIPVGDTLFRLEEMIVKFDNIRAEGQSDVTLPELIEMASAGRPFDVTVTLEFIPAVEHFAAEKKAQTFLSGEFAATIEDTTYHSHRCLACYPTAQERNEKSAGIDVANARLALIYGQFDHAGIVYRAQYFS
jgi:hypothetical protein